MQQILPASRVLPALLFFGGALPLVVAYGSQWFLGLHPCHFCLLQRYPYALPVVMGFVAFWRPQQLRRAAWLGGAGILASGVLGLYHTAIERGWVSYAGDCVAHAAGDGSLDALRAAIAQAPVVACNEVSAAVLGLSMASWNALWAGLVLMLLVRHYPTQGANS